MLFTRNCALSDCGVEFQTDNPRKKHCCPKHSTLSRMRRLRANRRKKGPGGGGNGGGGIPHLHDTIVPQDARAFTPIPVIGPKKPTQRTTPGVTSYISKRKKAA